jgi:hypothetical protein
MVKVVSRLTSNLAGPVFPAPGGLALPYKFSTTTTPTGTLADGICRLNNATQNLSTLLRVSITDVLAGSELTPLNQVIQVNASAGLKAYIRLTKLDDPSKWLQLVCSDGSYASTDGAFDFTITGVSGSTASPFANDDIVLVSFTLNATIGSGAITNGMLASAVKNPMTAVDDIIVGGAVGLPTRLAKGTSSRVFGVDALGALGYRQIDTPDLVANAVTRAIATVGGPTVTQAWSTAGDVDVNQLTLTFTATAGSVWLIVVNTAAYHSVTNGNWQIGVKINGTAYSRNEMYTVVGGSLGSTVYQTLLVSNTLGAISITFKVFAARVTAGTLTFQASTNGLTILEYKR